MQNSLKPPSPAAYSLAEAYHRSAPHTAKFVEVLSLNAKSSPISTTFILCNQPVQIRSPFRQIYSCDIDHSSGGITRGSKTRKFSAIKTGDAAKVKALLGEQPGLANAKTEGGLSAVLLATYYGHHEIALLLANRGAQLNIFEASAIGKADRVAELLEIDPGLANAFAEDGFQPLGLASFFGHQEVVKILLARGAQVNSASNNPQRVMPLHSAVAHQHLEIAKALLEHGADVNAPQQDDFTPLHEAAQNGQVEMIELLLDYEAEANPRKGDGKPPLALALEYNHGKAVELLGHHGGLV